MDGDWDCSRSKGCSLRRRRPRWVGGKKHYGVGVVPRLYSGRVVIQKLRVGHHVSWHHQWMYDASERRCLILMLDGKTARLGKAARGGVHPRAVGYSGGGWVQTKPSVSKSTSTTYYSGWVPLDCWFLAKNSGFGDWKTQGGTRCKMASGTFRAQHA